jgi:hypothetical protein
MRHNSESFVTLTYTSTSLADLDGSVKKEQLLVAAGMPKAADYLCSCKSAGMTDDQGATYRTKILSGEVAKGIRFGGQRRCRRGRHDAESGGDHI